MKTISELLQEGDPLRHEETWPASRRDSCRQAVLAAASGARVSTGAASRSRAAVILTAVLMVIAAASFGALVWSLFNSDLQAAIRFEIRLAENRPAPGLREAKFPGSHHSLYLHSEVIVTNSDIAAVRVIQAGKPSQYAIGIEFSAAGAEKLLAATRNHIGKPIAFLFDGQIVMAPLVRTLIGASAEITGNFTKSQAERIAKRIQSQ